MFELHPLESTAEVHTLCQKTPVYAKRDLHTYEKRPSKKKKRHAYLCQLPMSASHLYQNLPLRYANCVKRDLYIRKEKYTCVKRDVERDVVLADDLFWMNRRLEWHPDDLFCMNHRLGWHRNDTPWSTKRPYLYGKRCVMYEKRRWKRFGSCKWFVLHEPSIWMTSEWYALIYKETYLYEKRCIIYEKRR